MTWFDSEQRSSKILPEIEVTMPLLTPDSKKLTPVIKGYHAARVIIFQRTITECLHNLFPANLTIDEQNAITFDTAIFTFSTFKANIL